MTRPVTGWLSCLVLAGLMLTVAWSIESAGWAPGLGILAPAVLGGVLIGVLLCGLEWMPPTLSHVWSLVLGVLWTGYLGTFTLSQFGEGSFDPVLMQQSTIFTRLNTVRALIMHWFSITWNDKADFGYMFPTPLGAVQYKDLPQFSFVVLMALLLWLLAYIATWFVLRYASWWGAVMPSGFALLFNMYYASRGDPAITFLALFLLFALLLAAQTHLALRQERWQREHIGFSPDLGFDFVRDSLIVAVLVIAIGWLMPESLSSDSFRSIGDRMSSASQGFDRLFNRMFPNLNYPVRGGGTEFGADMSLGGSISLGDRAMFEAKVEGSALDTPRYWRMTAFDSYDGQTWQRTVAPKDVDAGTDLGSPAKMTVPLTQTIHTLQSETKQLFSAPDPQRFSVPVRAEVSRSDAADVMTINSRTALSFGAEYSVVSRVSVADEASLRAASSPDPAEITSRYLQLPRSVTPRTRELAAELAASAQAQTGGQAARYDVAKSIESYLRTIPYSEQIKSPPARGDRVDWFLFDMQKGYCDYYSSSFVVLARLNGIPARVAAGYATGTYQPETGVYRQHEFNAHTWPEVYFPDYGWIQFEPTAAQDPLVRPGSEEEARQQLAQQKQKTENADDEILKPDRDERNRDAANPTPAPGTTVATAPGGPALPIWPLAVIVALSLVAATAYQVVWRRPLTGLTHAEGAYWRLGQAARWLGLGQRESETSDEFGRRLGGVVGRGGEQIDTIVDAYVQERFARRPSHWTREVLSGAWRALQRPLVAAGARLGLKRVAPKRPEKPASRS